MRTPQRRDISARQDLLGSELRRLFDDYVQEDMPDELMQLAQRLQSAFEQQGVEADGAAAPDGAAPPGTAPARSTEVEEG